MSPSTNHEAEDIKLLPMSLSYLLPMSLGRTGEIRSERRERFPTAAALQKYVGVAPVTVRSGTSHRVHWRWACPKFQRQTFIEWTSQTIPRSFWAKTFYEKQKERGASHNAAVRALAFKWVRILWRCWVDQTPYNESRYLSALRKRHSPLLNFEAQTPK